MKETFYNPFPARWRRISLFHLPYAQDNTLSLVMSSLVSVYFLRGGVAIGCKAQTPPSKRQLPCGANTLAVVQCTIRRRKTTLFHEESLRMFVNKPLPQGTNNTRSNRVRHPDICALQLQFGKLQRTNSAIT